MQNSLGCTYYLVARELLLELAYVVFTFDLFCSFVCMLCVHRLSNTDENWHFLGVAEKKYAYVYLRSHFEILQYTEYL